MTETPFNFSSQSETRQDSLREWGRLFRLCSHPLPSETQVGAIVVPTGDWLERAEAALNFFVRIYNQQEYKPHLIITGKYSSQSLDTTHTGADARKIARAIKIRGQLSPEMKEKIVVEEKATNTKEQADNTYAFLKQGVVQGPLIVFVSAWHLPRWYSTLVKTILNAEEQELKTQFFVAPVFKPWSEESRDIRGRKRERIITEVDRIHRYRQQGDVATEEEVKRYVNWLREQKPNL